MVKMPLSFVLDCLLPERCILCGSAVTFEKLGNVPVCRNCLEQLTFPGEKRCQRCSCPLISERTFCMRCREREYRIERNVSAYLYGGHVKDLLIAFKARGQKRLAEFFAASLDEVYREEFSAAVIVPVPFRPAGKRKRGWDPIEAITSVLAVKYGRTVCKLLERSDGFQQKQLDYEGRLNNLKGKIRPLRTMSEIPASVVLLDDVFTTGATVDECASVLRSIGVARISALTIALDP